MIVLYSTLPAPSSKDQAGSITKMPHAGIFFVTLGGLVVWPGLDHSIHGWGWIGISHSERSSDMAHLNFHGVLPMGHRELGDAKGPGGSGVFDLFFDHIDLPGFLDLPALVVLATREVDLEKNFLTVNPPETITQMGFEEAKQSDCFVWRVLPNPSETWVLQMHQIPAGRLKPRGNVLGIHSRNEKGEQARVRDDFSVARIFLIYSTYE